MGDRFYHDVELPNVAVDPPAPDAGFVQFYARGGRPKARNPDGRIFDLGDELVLVSVNNSSPVEVGEATRWGEWNGAIGTSTGTITFNVTKDGTSGGAPVFADLAACVPQLTCLRDTDSNAESPWAHVRRVEDNRRVVVQVKRSNQAGILLGGTYFGNLNNSNAVTVYLSLRGELAP